MDSSAKSDVIEAYLENGFGRDISDEKSFALNAHERLEFGKGISDHDEPDLWQKDLTGEIELWIELGHPDEKRTAGMASASMSLNCSVQDGEVWFRDDKDGAVRVAMTEVSAL
jgi:uncharacterized protein YaeQ